GYIGFSVVLADTTVAYGWAEVTLQDDDNTQGVIHGWAYEDDGTSLRVGAIPEPASTLLIALGFMASALRRRR
ncbi:PEP-CTERM sorting domain-containing protein, partial [Akkermansiaceae bacterium]|nr:PEP-CTERM sorting domain-containing protein [Akkermansiaceae bacterium]